MPEDDRVFKAKVQNYLVPLAIVACPLKTTVRMNRLKRPGRSSGKSGPKDLEVPSINENCQKPSGAGQRQFKQIAKDSLAKSIKRRGRYAGRRVEIKGSLRMASIRNALHFL